MRSGVGPAQELRAFGIDALVDLPVGRRLGDHPQCFFHLRTPPALAAMGGPGFAVVARGEGWWAFPFPLDEEGGTCAVAFALASDDVSGTVTLQSADPSAPPRIDHRYADVIARGDFADAVETFRELAGAPALAGRGAVNADEGVDLRRSSPSAWAPHSIRWARARSDRSWTRSCGSTASRGCSSPMRASSPRT